MKQQNASSIASLRVSAALAVLWAVTTGPVSATPLPMPLAFGDIPMSLAAGSISLDLSLPPFPPVHSFLFVSLENHERRFALATNPFGEDRLIFTELPHQVPPESTVNLTAQLFIEPSLFSHLLYLDEEYRPMGELNLVTPSVQLGPVPPDPDATTGVTVPFTLRGGIGGISRFDHPGVAFDIIGRGTMDATFDAIGPSEGQPAAWQLQRVDYFIAPLPVPEPGSIVTLGSGLVGLCAVGRRRRRRSVG
jgi:PEP-CTERM motif-containing protein